MTSASGRGLPTATVEQICHVLAKHSEVEKAPLTASQREFEVQRRNQQAFHLNHAAKAQPCTARHRCSFTAGARLADFALSTKTALQPMWLKSAQQSAVFIDSPASEP